MVRTKKIINVGKISGNMIFNNPREKPTYRGNVMEKVFELTPW